jgi:hypothetical protein
VPYLGVDGVGEVHRRSPGGQRDHLPARGEDVDLRRTQVEPERFQELGRVGCLPLPVDQLPEPGHLADVRRVAAPAGDGLLLVLPVRGHAVLRPPVHAPGPDLQLDRIALRADHGRMQRLVHVELRHRDVVLEPPGNRVPPRVHRAEHRVAVPHRIDQDPDADQVVDLVEADVAGDHLLVDRVEMLGAPGHPRLQLPVAQVRVDLVDDLLQEHVPVWCTLGHHPRNLVVALGVQGGEGQVLELPLHGVHAQPVRQRGEDLQHLARLALLLLARQVAQGAHVVQPVGQLDDQDPDVARHGDDHLAHGLGGGGLAVLDLVQLGHPVDQRRYILAELAAQFRQRVGGVLDRVVQQRRADGLVVHAQLGEDRGHRERVGDVGVAAQPLLAGVPAGGHLIGALDEPDVCLGMRRPHRLGEGFKHRVHSPAARRAEARQPTPDRGAADGSGRCRGRWRGGEDEGRGPGRSLEDGGGGWLYSG